MLTVSIARESEQAQILIHDMNFCVTGAESVNDGNGNGAAYGNWAISPMDLPESRHSCQAMIC